MADENNLYHVALFTSLQKMDEAWGHLNNSASAYPVRFDYRHMAVVEDDELTNGLPVHHGGYHVQYLDHHGLIERCKQLQAAFPALIIHPVKTAGERLMVGCTLHSVSCGGGELMFGLSSWCNVFFRYDCDRRELVVDEVELGGI